MQLLNGYYDFDVMFPLWLQLFLNLPNFSNIFLEMIVEYHQCYLGLSPMSFLSSEELSNLKVDVLQFASFVFI